MLDLGWTEMLVIGIVALIVVGPKDLPGLFRSVGKFVGKAKGMAREFSSAMNAAADESGINEINKTIKAAANPQKFGMDKLREASGVAQPKEAGTKEAGKAQADTAKPKSGQPSEQSSGLSEERAATAKKLNEAMGKAAEKRIAAEKAEAAPKATKAAKPAKPAKAPKATKPAKAAKPGPEETPKDAG